MLLVRELKKRKKPTGMQNYCNKMRTKPSYLSTAGFFLGIWLPYLCSQIMIQTLYQNNL